MDIELLREALGESLYEEARKKVEGLEHFRVIDTESGNWIPRNRFDEERKGLSSNLKKTQEALEALRGEHDGLLEKSASESKHFKEQVAALRGDIRQRDEQIASLTGSLSDRDSRIESMKSDMESHEGKIRELTEGLTAREGEIRGLRLEGRAMEAVRKSGARDPELVMRLLDRTKLTEGEDGSLQGLHDQLEDIRKEAGYLFQREHAPRGGYMPSGGGEEGAGGSDINAAIRAAFGRR